MDRNLFTPLHSEQNSDKDDSQDSILLNSICSDEIGSYSPTLSLPDSFLANGNILDDIDLPSLGESKTAQKVLHHIIYNREFEALEKVSADDTFKTANAHSAIQTLSNKIKSLHESNDIQQNEINRLNRVLTDSKEEFRDLQCQRKYEDSLVSLETMTHTVQTQSAELARQRKQFGYQLESAQYEAKAAEERGNQLAQKLQLEVDLRRDSQVKADRCDLAERDARQLREEVSLLRETLTHQTNTLSALAESEKSLKDLLQDADRSLELLRMDKTYLQRELGDSVLKANNFAREVDRLQSVIQAGEEKVNKLTDQLLSVQLQTRSDFDERMEKEVQRLKDQYTFDINNLKESSKEIIDRENRMLREIKNSLENELELTKRRVDEQASRADNLSSQLSTITAEKNLEISQLRAEMKLRSFELSTLGTNFEEKCGLYKTTSMELELVREEMDLIKNASMKAELEYESRIRTLQDNLNRAQDTLRNITDDDCAMLAFALDDVPFDENTALSLHGCGTGVNRTYRLALTKLRNDMSKRLAVADVTITNLKVRLAELEKSEDALKKSVQKLERSLSLVPHPSSYLIQRIAELEEWKTVASNDMKQLQVEAERLENIEKENLLLQEQTRNILQQRSELSELKSLLAEIYDEDEQQEHQHNGEGDREQASNRDGVSHSPPSPSSSAHSSQSTARSNTNNSNSSNNNKSDSKSIVNPNTIDSPAKGKQSSMGSQSLQRQQQQQQDSKQAGTQHYSDEEENYNDDTFLSEADQRSLTRTPSQTPSKHTSSHTSHTPVRTPVGRQLGLSPAAIQRMTAGDFGDSPAMRVGDRGERSTRKQLQQQQQQQQQGGGDAPLKVVSTVQGSASGGSSPSAKWHSRKLL